MSENFVTGLYAVMSGIGYFLMYLYFTRSKEEKERDEAISEEVTDKMIEDCEKAFGSWGSTIFLGIITFMLLIGIPIMLVFNLADLIFAIQHFEWRDWYWLIVTLLEFITLVITYKIYKQFFHQHVKAAWQRWKARRKEPLP